MRCGRVTISGCRTVGPETVATGFGGSRRAETASDSSNRLASLSLGLTEPSAHRLATGDALLVLSAGSSAASPSHRGRHSVTIDSLLFLNTYLNFSLSYISLLPLDVIGCAHSGDFRGFRP